MIAKILDFFQFGPHEVPFVAPLMSMGVFGFIFILWLIKDVEEDRAQATKKAAQTKAISKD